MRSAVFGLKEARRRRLLPAVVFLLAVLLFLAGKYFDRVGVERVTVSAVDFPAAINIESRQEIDNIIRGLEASVSGGDPTKTYRDAKYEFSLYRGSREEKYLFNDHLSFYRSDTKKQLLASPQLKDILYRWIKEMEQVNPYGEMMDWEEVRKIFRRYDDATIIDLDTRLSFRVQRRAGSRHADVQPLTAGDTAVMKEVFGGRWTWRRRAILVEVNGRRLAGSMNGMPHGAGAIAGNNFRGHFCIHFAGSTTHGSSELDAGHQLMVWKAANKVEEKLRQAGPEQILQTFFTALEQGEAALAARMVDQSTSDENLQEGLRGINSVYFSLMKPAPSVPGGGKARQDYGERADLPVKVSWQGKKTGWRQNVPMTITLVKSGRAFPWLITRQSLKPLI